MEVLGMVGVLAAWAVSEFQVAPDREIASITQGILSELSNDATSNNDRATLVAQLQSAPGDTTTAGDINPQAWGSARFRQSWVRGLWAQTISLKAAGANMAFLAEMYDLPTRRHRDVIRERTNFVFRAITGGREAPSNVRDWSGHALKLEGLDYRSAVELQMLLLATWTEEYHYPVARTRDQAVLKSRAASSRAAALFAIGSILLVVGKVAEGWRRSS